MTPNVKQTKTLNLMLTVGPKHSVSLVRRDSSRPDVLPTWEVIATSPQGGRRGYGAFADDGPGARQLATLIYLDVCKQMALDPEEHPGAMCRRCGFPADEVADTKVPQLCTHCDAAELSS